MLNFYVFNYLELVGYGRYRKERSINESSKTDIRKQARKPKEILHRTTACPAQLYKKEVVIGGDPPPTQGIVVGEYLTYALL